MHTWKDQNSENPHQIFRFSKSIIRHPFCVQIWAPNSFWRLRYLSSKFKTDFDCSSDYLFPILDMNQKSRPSTENFFLGVRISSFFSIKGMCWGIQEKTVPAWFPSILVPENAGENNFALNSRYWFSLSRRERATGMIKQNTAQHSVTVLVYSLFAIKWNSIFVKVWWKFLIKFPFYRISIFTKVCLNSVSALKSAVLCTISIFWEN